MRNFNQMSYFPMAEKLVEVLQTRTQNSNPLFFRVITAYYFSCVAAQMRASIKGWTGKGTIPVNSYVIALSPSGSGKGHSTSLIENEILGEFHRIFKEQVFNSSALVNIQQIAIRRANLNGTDVQDEEAKLTKVFEDLGALLTAFGEATVPAVKQMRHKLQIANAGSCNLQVDEIGSNFSSIIDALNAFLELYDKGLIKDKLTKSSAENVRFDKIEGATPANLLLFGTPSKLLDGAKTEEQFLEMLETGYARRCIFGFTNQVNKQEVTSVDDLMSQLFNSNHDDIIDELNDHFISLADASLLHTELVLPKESIKLLLTYKLHCENLSAQLSEFETIRKAELEHRYFKVMKLAGAYAFVDKATTITESYIENAIKLIEDSGDAFAKLLTPQRPYIKLANYLAAMKTDVTLADLDEDLPSFRGSKAQKDEQITMATAWGYKNNIIIKKSYTDSILFLNAESIEETDLNKCIFSYSADMTEGYVNAEIKFDNLHKLLKRKDYHWLSHQLKNGDKKQGYRNEENCLTGFNLLVLDIDGGTTLQTAKTLLKGYKAIFQTTKRHTDETHRFRIILPMNYVLKLDAKEYKEFYKNIINEMPFALDEGCGHRSKKWLTHSDAHIEYQDGELFDVLPFIPKTSKNDDRQQKLLDQSNLDNLERWVINNTGDGNRNNMLLRYALILSENNFNLDTIKQKVLELNNKLMDKLDELEIHSTVFHTLAKRMANQ